MSIDLDAACQKAIDTFGEHEQMNMVGEECAELISELNRFRRARSDRMNVVSEMADVYIVCKQLRMMLNVSDEAFVEMIHSKVKKLDRRLGAVKNVEQ